MKRKLATLLFFVAVITTVSAENVYKKLTVDKCDSLIKANAANPNFVILDVRTANEWTGSHLEGSINRNYYSSDFQEQLDALPKHKIFLIHCQSGGRSAQAFAKMQNSNFAEVYDMIGGMSAWQKSYPTTTAVAPKLIVASNGGQASDTIIYGITDTLHITVTNRANDVLKFDSFTLPDGSEFSSDFELSTQLSGAEDYTFSVFYSPENSLSDSAKITIESNGGTVDFQVILKSSPAANTILNDMAELAVYPNPVRNRLFIKHNPTATIEKLTLLNLNGQVVLTKNYFQDTGTDVSHLQNGVYFARIKTGNKLFSKKLIVKH